MYCLETQALSYSFSKTEKILDAINLQVPKGCIYGFLGPNGAGKTTSLKLVMGLLKKQEGEISIFGQSFEKNRVALLKRVGALIESPSLYGQLTAFENLLVLQKVYQCPKSRIDEVLQLVGLSHTKNKKTSAFSLGMKQRLSIAMALLHDPELLILDEPTNGLDPNGILEMRILLKRLNQQNGTTLIISSHLLSEIEKLVTHVGVIHKGRLIFQDSLQALMNKQNLSSVVRLDTSDDSRACLVLQEAGFTAVEIEGKLVISYKSKEETASLIKKLIENKLDIFEVCIEKNDLETVFMDLTK
ncbi:multidrug ABC transporter ATP-binding protein [Sphingobacteriaceae bacterium]|nr:multidrug ABC transporter ATP-binding protein [Sphingobacteriaceae bacterium]